MDVKIALKPRQIYADYLTVTEEYVILRESYSADDVEDEELVLIVKDNSRRLAVVGREPDLNYEKVAYFVS